MPTPSQVHSPSPVCPQRSCERSEGPRPPYVAASLRPAHGGAAAESSYDVRAHSRRHRHRRGHLPRSQLNQTASPEETSNETQNPGCFTPLRHPDIVLVRRLMPPVTRVTVFSEESRQGVFSEGSRPAGRTCSRVSIRRRTEDSSCSVIAAQRLPPAVVFASYDRISMRCLSRI